MTSNYFEIFSNYLSIGMISACFIVLMLNITIFYIIRRYRRFIQQMEKEAINHFKNDQSKITKQPFTTFIENLMKQSFFNMYRVKNKLKWYNLIPDRTLGIFKNLWILVCNTIEYFKVGSNKDDQTKIDSNDIKKRMFFTKHIFRILKIKQILNIIPICFIMVGMIDSFIKISLYSIPILKTINPLHVESTKNTIIIFWQNISQVMLFSALAIFLSLILIIINSFLFSPNMLKKVIKKYGYTLSLIWEGHININKQIEVKKTRMPRKIVEKVSEQNSISLDPETKDEDSYISMIQEMNKTHKDEVDKLRERISIIEKEKKNIIEHEIYKITEKIQDLYTMKFKQETENKTLEIITSEFRNQISDLKESHKEEIKRLSKNVSYIPIPSVDTSKIEEKSYISNNLEDTYQQKTTERSTNNLIDQKAIEKKYKNVYDEKLDSEISKMKISHESEIKRLTDEMEIISSSLSNSSFTQFAQTQESPEYFDYLDTEDTNYEIDDYIGEPKSPDNNYLSALDEIEKIHLDLRDLIFNDTNGPDGLDALQSTLKSKLLNNKKFKIKSSLMLMLIRRVGQLLGWMTSNLNLDNRSGHQANVPYTSQMVKYLMEQNSKK